LVCGIRGRADAARERDFARLAVSTGYQHIDKVCDLVDKVADLSCQYWLKADAITATIEPRSRKIISLEAQIQGLQDRCTGYLDILCPRFDPESIDDVLSATAEFCEALTGGNFNSRRTEISPQQARQVHSSASALVVCLRKSMEDATSFTGTYKYFTRELAALFKKFKKTKAFIALVVIFILFYTVSTAT